MFEKKDLVSLANMPMPFGKYSGRVIIDLPEESISYGLQAKASLRASWVY